jgi:hypothetical protein
MSSDVSNLRDTIVPKSDQLNSEQLMAGPMTITVTAVRRGSDEQPIIVHYEGDDGRPYKPCKTMRKALIFAWGDDGRQWVGKSMTLFCDPEVKFGGVKVGGIRISHLSHVERDLALALTATKGRKETHLIRKLEVAAPPPPRDWEGEILAAADMPALQKVFTAATRAVKGDDAATARLIEAKDRRKAELETPVTAEAEADDVF